MATVTRWVLGPAYTLTRSSVAAVAAAAVAASAGSPTPVLPDVVPVFDRVDTQVEGTFFKIPAYDPSTANGPISIRTYFIPSGTIVDDQVETYTGSTSTLVYGEKDVSSFTTGVDVEVPFPTPDKAPDGDYIARPVYGYAS